MLVVPGHCLAQASREFLQLYPTARILVADDDAGMRDLLAAVLRRDGYEVTVSEDGDALMDTVSKFPEGTFDLVISDIQMPRVSGLRVLATIRRQHPRLPVVLITAFGSAEMHREAARLGATKVLDKPFKVADLRELVGDLLQLEPV